jgi:hypothetical protein
MGFWAGILTALTLRALHSAWYWEINDDRLIHRRYFSLTLKSRCVCNPQEGVFKIPHGIYVTIQRVATTKPDPIYGIAVIRDL